MAALNVTPDSFSDGGQFTSVDAAVARARQMEDEGADMIDIGGESTRPGAEPVSGEEELRRTLPVIEKLAGRVKVPLSIDTIKPAVARAAVKAGVSVINDIAGNRTDLAMWEIVAETKAGYVLTHLQGTPQTMRENPTCRDVAAEVDEFFGARLQQLAACGVSSEQVALDVGIGFGKGLEHNLQLLGQLRRFKRWGRPLVLGASRKSFMGRLLGAKLEERLGPSLACACWAAEQGVQIIRCHDVAATRLALRMTEALLERQKNAEHH